jgi:hypothetical protein
MPEPTPEQLRDAVQADTTERRAFVRYYLLPSPQVPFLLREDIQLGIALLKDVSAGGVCLLLDRPAAIGARLMVQLPGRARGGSLARTAVVSRVTPGADGVWEAGCRLNPILSEQELSRLRLPDADETEPA